MPPILLITFWDWIGLILVWATYALIAVWFFFGLYSAAREQIDRRAIERQQRSKQQG